MLNIDDRLNKIEAVITEKDFLNNKGLGNEVGYYIFDYSPKDESFVRNHIAFLKNKINSSSMGVKIVEYDLYNLMIQILDEEGYLETCFEKEKDNGYLDMAGDISDALGLDNTNELNLIVTHILENTPEHSIVFLTGVGKCFPIIRSHNILNNLHQVLDTVPVILFFPGKYNGQELQLFGTVKDNNYYRAFKLV
jgi:hypothetical protein